MIEKPKLIKGGKFSDDRGEMRFVNDFRFDGVKRFYFIRHLSTSVIRAWQGHQFEKKYFYPISGSFVVAWVEIDNFENPSQDLVAHYQILSAKDGDLVSIPKGYANGLKALEPNSEIMVLSDMSLEESINEKIRYPSNWWLNWKDLL
jgi:dTDP-4-dehydrorhamnose 3,5-epimerase